MQPRDRVPGPGRAPHADGTEGPVRGARLAALFAALAAAGGRPVPAAALAGQVWAGGAPGPEGVGGMRAWVDCMDGGCGRVLERLARAVDDLATPARLVAPYLLVAQFATGAWALGGRGRSGDARTGARLLGAYDAHAGGGRGGGFRPYTPQTDTLIRRRAEAVLRAALTPEAYDGEYAAGAALAVVEAAALLRRTAYPGPARGARMRGGGADTRMASAGTHPQKHGGDGMNAEPDEKSRGDVPTPDRLLHAGSEGEFTAEDLVLASGRDVTPKTLAWAERRMAEKGRASLDELLP